MWWLTLTALAADPAALLSAYDAVRVQLVENRLVEAQAASRALGALPDVSPAVVDASGQLSAAADLGAARLAFGEISRGVVRAFTTDEPPAGLKVFYCPMTSAWPYWLQPTSGIANPYMGVAMPRCGEGTSLKAAQKALDPVKP